MEIESALDYLSEVIDSLKEQKAAILEKVEEEVAKLGEVDMGDYIIKYKQPYERVTLDSAKIKDKHPEIFEKYQKSTIVKGSISINIK
jgi:predicted phage-related endonuclease